MKFAGNVDFCGCNEDFNKKLKGKMCFLLFFCEVENSHFCCC